MPPWYTLKWMAQTSELQAASALRQTLATAVPRVLPENDVEWAQDLVRRSQPANLASAHTQLTRALRERRHSHEPATVVGLPSKSSERRILTLHLFGHSHAEVARFLDLSRRQVQEKVEAAGELGPLRETLGMATGARGDCPEPVAIYEAASTPALTGHLADHLAQCPACAESWRLAIAIGQETEAAAEVIQLFDSPNQPKTKTNAEHKSRRPLPKLELPTIDWRRAALAALIGGLVVAGLIAAAVLPTY